MTRVTITAPPGKVFHLWTRHAGGAGVAEVLEYSPALRSVIDARNDRWIEAFDFAGAVLVDVDDVERQPVFWTDDAHRHEIDPETTPTRDRDAPGLVALHELLDRYGGPKP